MDEENDLIALRRQKLEALHARGVRPFGAAFSTDRNMAEVRAKFADELANNVECNFVSVDSAVESSTSLGMTG
jgi:lysyl-tRNA synthetase class II